MLSIMSRLAHSQCSSTDNFDTFFRKILVLVFTPFWKNHCHRRFCTCRRRRCLPSKGLPATKRLLPSFLCSFVHFYHPCPPGTSAFSWWPCPPLLSTLVAGHLPTRWKGIPIVVAVAVFRFHFLWICFRAYRVVLFATRSPKTLRPMKTIYRHF